MTDRTPDNLSLLPCYTAHGNTIHATTATRRLTLCGRLVVGGDWLVPFNAASAYACKRCVKSAQQDAALADARAALARTRADDS